MTPEHIEISVETNYIDQQSQPDAGRFVYAYTITIRNCCDTPAQLISRHWVITDANNARHEVRGLGVVGEQPRLQPGEAFTYTSGVVIETETGTMEGSYQMRTDEDLLFDTPIPAFALVPPHAVH
ncbi:Co2+/Mg2+ efflux protein ApaG [Exilibacterium tricleocarpae]|uniref:Protein ApaG n=1 Tax=Exilibacterium tricleocarpae TaxID=2591008 RepID=A0A545T3K1_9GAMM|nr:Co2+/Mg2+ efflux protein ApaG [Exilibacterium tricleocarpae]TQV71790.1 Co2+/Mg2+ efflux protein ApaG [Exilibacterium tricleocarpae]